MMCDSFVAWKSGRDSTHLHASFAEKYVLSAHNITLPLSPIRFLRFCRVISGLHNQPSIEGDQLGREERRLKPPRDT